MLGLRVLFSRIRGFLGSRASDRSLNEELQMHLELLTQENIRRGMGADDARAAARREFGGLEQITELYRDQRGFPVFESVSRDFRFGLRMLCQSPGFAALAVLTLAIGIGANTAVFSLVDAVLLQPLPYRNTQQLLLLTETLPQMGGVDEVGVSAAEYLDYRSTNRCFSEIAAYQTSGFNLTGGGTPLRVRAASVSASLFPLLGTPPALGRTFAAGEDREGAGPVAVLSYSLWRDRFGLDGNVLGTSIRLDGKPFTVIGVMPASFQFPLDGAPLSDRVAVWVPLTFPADLLADRVREFGVGVVGRLKPGITPALAQQDLVGTAEAFMQQHPESYGGTVRVAPRSYPLAVHAVAKVRSLVLLLEAVVICVLVIACANVANLLLARSGSRRREMAVRSAVGADRARLFSQCIIESGSLAFAGTVAGLIVASLLLSGARRFAPLSIPQLRDIHLNSLALSFTVVLSVITTIFFGLVPALQLSGVPAQSALKDSVQLGGSSASRGIQGVLVVLEIGAALSLLLAGSLLLQSFTRLLNAPMGFRPDNTIVVRAIFDRSRYPDPLKREAVQKELLVRLSAIPGVRVAAEASHLPLSDVRQIGFHIEGAAPNEFHWAQNSLISPGYFQAMGISLLRGRDFTDRDSRTSPNVAVISEALARQYFPGADPIGKHFAWGDRAAFTVIGVAADVRVTALDADPPPMIYDSMFQVESGASDRTAFILKLREPDKTSAPAFFASVREQVWSIDKDLPVYGTATLDSLVEASISQRRFTLVLISAFGLIALALAIVGLFGVVSYLVSLRQAELAVRMALGAPRIRVALMILRQAAALGIIGCGFGLFLFLLGSPLLAGSLYEITPRDLPTIIIIPAIMFFVTLLAAYVPAQHAMRLDPMAALRYE